MKSDPSLSRAFGALLLPLGLALAASSPAQDYPTRPIRLITAAAPGGTSDILARVFGAQLSEVFKQPVVVDNRASASGVIAGELTANAPPDGYTLLLASQTNAISATLYAKLNFLPIDDFAPIGLIAREPGVLVVHPSFPAKSVQELIALAKQKPGEIHYASSGNGSGQHLFAAMFASMAGVKLTHVPYKGSGQATTDLIGGFVPVSMPGLAGMLGHIRAGKLRALAVTGEKRSPALPDVPTLAEAGVPGYSAYVWMGLLAPKATPAPILDKLRRDLLAVLATAEVKAYMEQHSLELIASTPAQFDAFFREERDRWAKIIAETGAQVD
jgi:tripartite-type tricarboxylate transporter receptor subunit TctC